MKALRLLLLLAASVAGLSQRESEPYFALSTTRTFGSNGKPSVALSAWSVDSLEFRVYRVADPVRFFQQMEDPHRFGGSTPRPPRERTLLERIVRWKRSLRAEIRRSLRAQFTESPSAHFESLFPRESRPASKEIHYASAPVLNSQQLALSFMHPVRSRTRWERQTVDIGVTEKGVYLVEAVRGDLRAYTILMVSDIVLITKSAGGRILNFVVDRNSGEPLRNVPLVILGDGAETRGLKTGEDGSAESNLATRGGAVLRVVAHTGSDVAINTAYRGPLDAEAGQWMGYIFTDRPVYRPGPTVHFKGILRLRTGTGFEVPAGRTLDVAIKDPDQKPVYQKTLTAAASGAIRDDLVLPAATALGSYTIEVKSDETFLSGHFDVEEYKKPEYEVRVTPSKSRVLQGETVQATIDARYYFGEPVNAAKVTYAIFREPYWFPLWYDPDENESMSPDESGDGGDSVDFGDQVGEQQGQLDSEGKLTIEVPTTLSEHKSDYRYRIEARVSDMANREIIGRGWMVATYGSLVLNVSPERYLYTPGSKATVNVQARTYDEAPAPARAHVELLKWNYRSARQLELKGAADIDLGAGGSASATFDLPNEAGQYRVHATARTPEGRDVESTTYLWVSGRDYIWESSNRGVQIITDQKTYRAGDTAKLLILAGQANTPVYVSVEGRELRQYKLVRAADGTAPFEIPVTAADEPGITVNAAYVRGGLFYNGTKYVRVPAVQHALNVKLATSKPQYLPGEGGEYTIDVAGADGKPVPRAEFSLGVVDEAIYGIRRDTTPDILKFFFDREWNRVATESSLNYYFSGEAGKRRMQLAELRPPSRLAQLKPERLVQPKIRKAFPDTAFWAADIVTDQSGRARAKVEFPDSLTTWRATARGATADTRVGSATLKTIVRKNLILRLATPRFFVQGDEVVISAVVHNYLADQKTVRVSMDFAGLDVLDGITKDVPVPSRGEVKIDWRVRAQQVGKATITGKALTNAESDAVEIELPVNVPGVKLAESRGGSLPAGGSVAFDLAFPAKAMPGSRSLTIGVAPSIAGSLFSALEYLTSYPYGCVEQTMSSFLPNIVVRQAVRDLGLNVNLNEAALTEKIRAGVERLQAFQHEDGGWGWWETDQSHPFMTAYVVAGLVQSLPGGAPVKPEAIRRGVDWIRRELARDPKLAADLRAYMAYAMTVAGQPEAAVLNQLADRRSALSSYGAALLGLALEQTKDARAAEIAGLLENMGEKDQEQAWWPATRDPMLDFSADISAESTAWVVRFLSHQRRESPMLPKAALWLMNHRNEGYFWSSTKQTAMVIYGLTDYLKNSNELKSNLAATVFVNDRPVLNRKIDQAAGVNLSEIILDEGKVNTGSNTIRITTSGEGRLYYYASAVHFSSEDRLQRTGSASLNILRDYFRLIPVRVGDRIAYDTAPLSGPAAIGDVIAVRLTISGSGWKYLMIEDPIPAGTEFIERDNVYELRNRPPWWYWGFARRELHDDHTALFQNDVPPGQQAFFYLLKVVNPGVFQVSPARAQPMYQSGVMATTENVRLEVK